MTIEPIIGGRMHISLREPEDACEPVICLCAAPDAAGDTGWDLHRMRTKDVSQWASTPEHDRKISELARRGSRGS